MKKNIIVALSGGVDSSVAALLLKKSGFKVSAGYIKGYNVDGCQDEELNVAKNVASFLNIPFYVVDLEKEYKNKVVDYMINGYKKGITPNPDVVCNSRIKFGLFLKWALNSGFTNVASGHYAILKNEIKSPKYLPLNWFKREYSLYAGVDKNKDQSYFLWQIKYDVLKYLLFPIGKYKKYEIRKIAKKNKLFNADKKDSQGICFLGKFDFAGFLKQYIKPRKGYIFDVKGKKVGEHDGVWFYTIGQRHGFKNTSGVPFYVVKKDIENNKLIVAYNGDNELYSDSIVISNINFLDFNVMSDFSKGKIIKVLTRIRYRQELRKAVLKNISGENAILKFYEKKELFPASGQSAVFYNSKGKVLGGGIIV